jgi:hypothetical protein
MLRQGIKFHRFFFKANMRMAHVMGEIGVGTTYNSMPACNGI